MPKEVWCVAEAELIEKITPLLQDLPNIMEGSLLRIGEKVREEARDRAPVETGALKASICVTTSRTSDHATCVSAARSMRSNAQFGDKTDPPKDAVDIHATAHYATYQELGTRYHGPQSFLIPGLLAVVRQMESIISGTLVQSVKRLRSVHRKWQ